MKSVVPLLPRSVSSVVPVLPGRSDWLEWPSGIELPGFDGTVRECGSNDGGEATLASWGRSLLSP